MQKCLLVRLFTRRVPFVSSALLARERITSVVLLLLPPFFSFSLVLFLHSVLSYYVHRSSEMHSFQYSWREVYQTNMHVFGEYLDFVDNSRENFRACITNGFFFSILFVFCISPEKPNYNISYTLIALLMKISRIHDATMRECMPAAHQNPHTICFFFWYANEKPTAFNSANAYNFPN